MAFFGVNGVETPTMASDAVETIVTPFGVRATQPCTECIFQQLFVKP